MEKPLMIADEAMLLLVFSQNNIIVNTEDNHYKFWTYSCDKDGLFTAYWGRIGKTFQQSQRKFYSEKNARNEAALLIRSKIRKGYRPLNFKMEDL